MHGTIVVRFIMKETQNKANRYSYHYRYVGNLYNIIY